MCLQRSRCSKRPVLAIEISHPRCVTILLTGYRASETALEAIHQQADDYIAKPADIDALFAMMKRKLLARSRTSP